MGGFELWPKSWGSHPARVPQGLPSRHRMIRMQSMLGDLGPIALFEDRRDAGHRLAQALRKYRSHDAVVLALPPGGVPVAHEVAKALHAPLDLLFVRRFGAPDHPDLYLGAVVDGPKPQLVVNDELLRALAPPPEFLAGEQQRHRSAIEQQRMLYLNGRPPLALRGRTVIIVDDGVTTGIGVRSALKAIDRSGPEWLVLAIPLAPPPVLLDLQSVADEVVCLSSPEPFLAVGNYYNDFTATSDEEVIALLGASRARGAASPAVPENGNQSVH